MADHSHAVAALLKRCTKALADSDVSYRGDWPDVGKSSRELLHKRTLAVLEATGVPLEVLAGMDRNVGSERVVAKASGALAVPAAIPNVEVRRRGWWRK